MESSQKTIHCKFTYKDQIRRALLTSFSYKEVDALARSLYSLLNETLLLKYKDQENDLVSISTDLDIDTAIAYLPPNAPLRITILDDSPDSFPRKRNRQKTPKEPKPKRQRINPPKKQAKSLKAQYKIQFQPKKTLLPPAPNTSHTVSIILMNNGITLPNGSFLAAFGRGENGETKIPLGREVLSGTSLPVTINVVLPENGKYRMHWGIVLPDGTKLGQKVFIKTEPVKREPRVKREKKKPLMESQPNMAMDVVTLNNSDQAKENNL